MNRVRKPSTAILLAGLLLSLLVPATAGAGADVLTGDIQHVANLSYSSGTDLEFASREVVKLSEGATGDPVCATDESGVCLVDENGETIFETEIRDFAIAGRSSQNAWIIDITDPANPAKAGEVPCRANQNDIQVRDDLLVVGQDSGAGQCDKSGSGTQPFTGSAVLDFSDPRNPVFMGRLQEGRGAHNNTLHPTEPLVYISNSDQVGDGRVHIFDVSDPANPVRVQDWVFQPVESPHDITFNADGTRAYMAARTFTHIVDTTDPRNPVLISSLPHHGYLSHQADPTPDGKYLIVDEELLGGGFDTPSPGGPVIIWDIRDETKPVEIGAFANDETGLNGVSTAHVFRINPDGYTMAIAWYEDGIGVFDYSDVRGVQAASLESQTGVGARLIGWAKMDGADAWSAKMWQERHPGYVFVNDIARGFDVFYTSELGPGFVATGVLKGTHSLGYASDIGVTRQEWEADCDYTPANNGVDGWVLRVPSSLADGTHTLTAAATSALGVDLDLYFYDADCGFLGEDQDEGGSETGDIPADTAYALVTGYNVPPTAEPIRLRITAD